MKMKVVVNGKGKVKAQSIAAGTKISKGQTVYLEMNIPTETVMKSTVKK
jgi:PASTA domain